MERASLLIATLVAACTARTIADESVWDAPDRSSSTGPATSEASGTGSGQPGGVTSSPDPSGSLESESSSSGGPPICAPASTEVGEVSVSVSVTDLDPTIFQAFDVPCTLLQWQGGGLDPIEFLFQCAMLPPELSTVLVVRVEAPGIPAPDLLVEDAEYDVRFMQWRDPDNPYRFADHVAFSRDGALLLAAGSGSHWPGDPDFFAPFGLETRLTGCSVEPPLECHDLERGNLRVALGDEHETLPDYTVGSVFDYDIHVGSLIVSDAPSCGELAIGELGFAIARW